MTSNRVCQGYGIWGGGGNIGVGKARQIRIAPSCQFEAKASLPATVSQLNVSLEDKEYFDWFKCRTSGKLQGSFISDFWTTLLLQGSFSEPAVLHAVLALSSVHRRGILHEQGCNSVPDQQMERFTLQHYTKAINNLRPHFSAKDRASVRVVLISCLVFLSLDILRGHFTSAQLHLQNGLKLLNEWQSSAGNVRDLVAPRGTGEAIDIWTVELFTRLRVQAELFNHMFLGYCPPLRLPLRNPPKCRFLTFKDAWNEMDSLLHNTIYVTQQARLRSDMTVSTPAESPLFQIQQEIKADLEAWFQTYHTSREVLCADKPKEFKKAYDVLNLCYAMVTIMVHTAISPNDEMVYDLCTNQFIDLIKQAVNIAADGPRAQDAVKTSKRYRIHMAHSIIDMGWVAPLYYAATKCRVHRIRLQAIKLMGVTFHREGLWDCQIAGIVARRIMEIEEGEFYQSMQLSDGFATVSYPEPDDLILPIIPGSHRLEHIQVVLAGEPLERIFLLGERSGRAMRGKVCLGEYDMEGQRWIE